MRKSLSIITLRITMTIFFQLCFRKGDVITITQMDDGGWWEGTLNDKTGWFPSNYVKEQKLTGENSWKINKNFDHLYPNSSSLLLTDNNHLPLKSSPEKTNGDLLAQQKANRSVVLKDIIDSERVNVAELQGLVNNFLQPLEATSM